MNELKPTYGKWQKRGIEQICEGLMSAAYNKRFAIEVDAMTGDFELTCLETGNHVSEAEVDLMKVSSEELFERCVKNTKELLVAHIEQFALMGVDE